MFSFALFLVLLCLEHPVDSLCAHLQVFIFFEHKNYNLHAVSVNKFYKMTQRSKVKGHGSYQGRGVKNELKL